MYEKIIIGNALRIAFAFKLTLRAAVTRLWSRFGLTCRFNKHSMTIVIITNAIHMKLSMVAILKALS